MAILANVGWRVFLWEFISRPWAFGGAVVVGFLIEWFTVRELFNVTRARSLAATSIANAVSLGLGSLVFGLTPILVVVPGLIAGKMWEAGGLVAIVVLWPMALALLGLAIEYPILRGRLKCKLSWYQLGVLYVANLAGSVLIILSLF